MGKTEPLPVALTFITEVSFKTSDAVFLFKLPYPSFEQEWEILLKSGRLLKRKNKFVNCIYIKKDLIVVWGLVG